MDIECLRRPMKDNLNFWCNSNKQASSMWTYNSWGLSTYLWRFRVLPTKMLYSTSMQCRFALSPRMPSSIFKLKVRPSDLFIIYEWPMRQTSTSTWSWSCQLSLWLLKVCIKEEKVLPPRCSVLSAGHLLFGAPPAVPLAVVVPRRPPCSGVSGGLCKSIPPARRWYR